jgi:hypothetical protein
MEYGMARNAPCGPSSIPRGTLVDALLMIGEARRQLRKLRNPVSGLPRHGGRAPAPPRVDEREDGRTGGVGVATNGASDDPNLTPPMIAPIDAIARERRIPGHGSAAWASLTAPHDASTVHADLRGSLQTVGDTIVSERIRGEWDEPAAVPGGPRIFAQLLSVAEPMTRVKRGRSPV